MSSFARVGGILLKLLDLVLWTVTIAYPFLVWQALEHWSPRIMALLLAAVLLMRLLRRYPSLSSGILPWLALAGALFLLGVAWINETGWLLAYPVFVSLAFFSVFSLSLLFPPTVIERLARLEDPDLPLAGVAYTRKVTMVWSVFFLLNTAVSLATVLHGDPHVWTLYNGAIFYVLMGLLMGIELLIRRKAKARFCPK